MAQVWKWIAAVLAAAPMAGPTGAQSREPVASGLYCGRDLGHWFYCSRPAPEPDAQREEAVSPAAAIRATREQTLQDAKAYVAELEHARLIAAYSPTPENVRYYQELQYDATERAAVYTDHWRRNVWSDASLDYTTRRPMAQFANHTFVDERAAEMTTDLANLADQAGLFYFYRSDCPYCQRFSPVLRGFADRYGVEVRAISVDGGPMPDFPNATPDRGEFARLLEGRQSVVPAVLLLDTETGTPHWITFGLISGQELAERIFVTMSREVGEDF
jgi:conjugal transfer pilus assembly protein TraF